MPPPQSFLEILQRVWWRLDRALDEASLRASARLYLAEALLAGTTTVIDHHESPDFIEGSLDVLAEAAGELGAARSWPMARRSATAGSRKPVGGWPSAGASAEANRNPRIRALVGLHASFTVSDGTIREAGALAEELGTQLHVHVAEDAADVVDAQKRGFAGPLERLFNLGGLPPGSILAHGVHLDEAQVRRAAQRGCWLVQNPRSNEGNRVGYPRALSASSKVAIGTDGYPADMAVEAAALRGSPPCTASSRPETSGCERAARAASFSRASASGESFEPPILPGSAADIVVSEEARILHVVVAGRVVVEGGRLLTGDLEQIRATARDEATRLWSRMDAG